MRQLLFVPLLLIVAAFALVGCGGGDDTDTAASGGSDDDAQITQVITTATTTTSRANCMNLMTTRFVNQNSAKTGAAAIQDCATNDPGETDADSVDVSNIQVDGDKATANVAITGSVYDGQTLGVSLVKEDDQWKLDHVDSFVQYDAGALADAFAKSLGGPNGDLTPTQIKCITTVVRTAPPQTVQTALLSGDQAQIQALFTDC